MKMRAVRAIIAIQLQILIIIFSGCTALMESRPVADISEVVQLKKYQVIQVEPATNETGKSFDFDVAGRLTKCIKEALQDRGYAVTDKPDPLLNILVVRSSIIAYEPGSAIKRWLGAPLVPAGKTQATVKTTLVDKKTGDVVATIVSAEAVTGGGLYSIGADKGILEVIAKGVANEIDRRMKAK